MLEKDIKHQLTSVWISTVIEQVLGLPEGRNVVKTKTSSACVHKHKIDFYRTNIYSTYKFIECRCPHWASNLYALPARSPIP